MELTKHDSRLVVAAITYMLAIASSGEEGAKALGIGIKNRNARKAILDATGLLAISTEGATEDELLEPSGDVFKANLERLRLIGKGLLGVTANGDTGDFTPAVMEPIAADGKVTGPKQYQLWLTHEQIHLVHWAVTFAEAAVEFNHEALAKAAEVYAVLREGELDSFVTKFNQVHEVARVADGETSTYEDDTKVE